MSWQVKRGGFLIEEGDDTTRTVTTYDEDGTVTSTRPYTAFSIYFYSATEADVYGGLATP